MGEDGIAEYESFNPEDTGELCENNPQDPLCFVQPVGGQGAPEADIFGPVDGEPFHQELLQQILDFGVTNKKLGNLKNRQIHLQILQEIIVMKIQMILLAQVFHLLHHKME